MEHTKGRLLVRCGSVYTEEGVPIAHMDRSPENGTLPVERDSNAHFIVRAWNTHYDLLVACEIALPWLITLGNSGMNYLTLPEDIKKLQQAITEAERRDEK